MMDNGATDTIPVDVGRSAIIVGGFLFDNV
jgi:hypothetical protein